ncbi:protein Tob1-like [Dendronephthya gigantea]|uniref:protein Tob1-like n=1 Tax=Dendronephthya gigantea TaxID=151771 RepID=UPI00106D3512|nr:protein Tob1-like [Dendronephthya gigantea]
MLLEIQIAVSFLTSYLYNKLPRRRVDLFGVELTKQLREKFEGHWYPQRPSKGSGYRCLLIGDDLDPVLVNAANDSGLSLEEIRSSLPDKLTMWIDPDEVSYRIEDQLVVKVIYQKDKYGELENLAELEGFNAQQMYAVSTTSPSTIHTSEVEQTYNRSPIQTSPLTMLSNTNHSNYSLWSTEENVHTQTPVDSRLSPNAQEFRYPVAKQSQHSPTNSLYQKDSLRFNEFPSYMWSNLSETSDRRQEYTSLQSIYSNWLDSSNSYKRSYNASQLEVMA